MRNKFAPTSRHFNLSDVRFHLPHQLRPDLRDRNPQFRPYALAGVEGKNPPIACGARDIAIRRDLSLYSDTTRVSAPHGNGHPSKLRSLSMLLNLNISK